MAKTGKQSRKSSGQNGRDELIAKYRSKSIPSVDVIEESPRLDATALRLYLKAFLRDIPQEQRVRLIDLLSEGDLRHLLETSSVRINPRYLKSSQKMHLVSNAINANPRQDHIATFFKPLLDIAATVLDDSQMQTPSSEDFERVLVALRADWADSVIGAYMAHIALSLVPASPFATTELLRLLEQVEKNNKDLPNESENNHQDIDVVVERTNEVTIKIPSMDEDITTPLGRSLIRIALDTATNVQGSLDREGYELMLAELSTLNSSHMPTWFQIGFSSGLGLVADTYLLDSPAINSERRCWHMWGYLKGLQRRLLLTEIGDVLVAQWDVVREMLDYNIGLELLPTIVEVMIDRDLDRTVELIRAHPVNSARPLEFELDVASKIDSKSVKLLQSARPEEAHSLLLAGSSRLQKLLSNLENFRHFLALISDFQIRFAIGLSASARSMNNYERAQEYLIDVSEKIKFVRDPKVVARFHLQEVLSNTHMQRINNVHLPRNKEESEIYLSKFARHKALLNSVLELPTQNQDAHYILAGLEIAEGYNDGALRRLGNVRADYESRKIDRASLIAEIRIAQLMLKFKQNTEDSIHLGVDDFLATDFSTLTFRRNEVEEIVISIAEKVPSRMEDLVQILSNMKSLNIDHEIVQKMLDHAHDDVENICLIARSLPSLSERLSVLIQLLNKSLETNSQNNIDRVLEEIDDLRSHVNNPAVHRLWSSECRENKLLRNYLGRNEADTVAIASLALTNDVDAQISLLEQAIQEHFPVRNAIEQASINVLIDAIEPLDPIIAKIFREDQLAKQVDYYVPWQEIAIATESVGEPIHIVFTGNIPDTSHNFESLIASKLASDFKEQISVQYVIPGWGSNWPSKAEQIERDFDTCDALVLMPLVRTNYGRRIRKSAGEHNIPWVPCTGSGHGIMYASIREAVNVVRSARTSE